MSVLELRIRRDNFCDEEQEQELENEREPIVRAWVAAGELR